MSIIKPYYCGKCNSRFWTKTKYCPKCGAYTSIPLYVDSEAAQRIVYEIPWKLWGLFFAVMLMLGAATFYGIMAVRVGRNNDAENKKYDTAAPAPAPVVEYARVKTGSQVVCDPCGALIDDRVGYVNVPKADAGKYGVTVTHTSECNACSEQDSSGEYYYGYEPEQKEETPRPGMAKKLVLKLWGDPIKIEFRRRGKRVIERWYFGDPLFRIGTNNRYVEFDESGSVVFVRGMSGLGR